MLRRIVVLLVSGLCIATAMGQESVSVNSAEGDLMWSYDLSSQRHSYVVDMHPFESSMGRPFYVAPIIKPNRTDTEYVNSYISHQGISRTQYLNKPFPADSYAYWNAPGYGLNPLTNLAPLSSMAVDTTGWAGNQFAVGFADFSIETSVGANNIVGGVVNVIPDDPSRVYVTRIVAAINGQQLGENRSQFGFGTIDSDGNLHFRADDYGITGPQPLLDDNYLRVDLLGRNTSALNMIDVFGAADTAATDWLLQYDVEVHNPPQAIPEQIAQRPVLIGSNFYTEYVYEASINSLIFSQAHAGPLVGLEPTDPEAQMSDHRGAIAYSPLLHTDPQAVGTCAMLAKYGSEEPTDNIMIWQVTKNATLIDQFALALPATIPWAIPETSETGAIGDGPYGPGGEYETLMAFDHYHSQTAFRGGVSQLAIGADQQGRAMVAGPVYDHSASIDKKSNPYVSLAVARFDLDNPVDAEWAVAAFIDQTGDDPSLPFPAGRPPLTYLRYTWRGSPLYDANGEEIGQLSPWYTQQDAMDVLSADAKEYGPSMSAPAIDSVGNIYFISSMQIYDECPPAPDYDPETYDSSDPSTWFWTVSCHVGLVRAVYDPSTFTYKCELLLKMEDVLPGLNSGIPYQITHMAVKDEESVDSATLWSGNVMQDTVNGVDRTSLDTEDPMTLGGLVFMAGVTYDTDTNGVFESEGDETYDVLMLVRGREVICDNAVVYQDDIPDLVGCLAGPGVAVSTSCVCSDMDEDGDVDLADVAEFQRRFEQAVPRTANDAPPGVKPLSGGALMEP